jgi:hypothetical protein
VNLIGEADETYWEVKRERSEVFVGACTQQKVLLWDKTAALIHFAEACALLALHLSGFPETIIKINQYGLFAFCYFEILPLQPKIPKLVKRGRGGGRTAYYLCGISC